MRHIAVMISMLNVLVWTGYAQDTVKVSTGWNILGSLESGIVPADLVSDPPGIIVTAMYGYKPGEGYETATTLDKGKGYWVKVSADGVIIFEGSGAAECGAKRVMYAGVSYHTVKIGTQCWLEENLNVGGMITGVTEQTDNARLEKYCYGDDPTNCALYGGLYQWNEAMQYMTLEGAPGICPPGWHMPTTTEFLTLASSVGADGNALKAIGWGAGAGAGTNTSGFSALLVGRRELAGGFSFLGDYAYFWSSVELDGANAYPLNLNFSNSSILLYDWNSKNLGFSVRCLENY